METIEDEFMRESKGYVEVCVGVSQWKTPDGLFILEEDFKVSGEVWRVHLSDADPFPSVPHAHCIGGANRFVGCTLHLGTGELFRKRASLKRYLDADQFSRLIALIQPKFPHIKLPLKACET